MAELRYKKNQPVNTKFKPAQFRKGDTALKRNVPTDPKLHDLYYGILKTVRAYLTDLYGDRNYNDKYKQIAELIITSINTNKTEGSKPEAISSAIDSANVKLNDDTKKSLVDTLSAQIGKSLSADSSKVSSKLDEFFKRDDTKTAQQKAAQEKTDKKLDAASKRLEMLDQSQSVMDKVMSGISGAVSTMMGLVGSVISSIGTVLSTIGSIMTSIASIGLSIITFPIKIVGSILSGIGSILFKTMGLILSPLWNFTKKIASIIWNVVSKPFKMIGSLISDGFSFMKTAFKKIATTGLKTFLLSPFGMFAMGYIGGFVYKRFIEPLIDWFRSTRVYKAFAGLFAGDYTFAQACKVFLFGEKYAKTDWMVIFEEKWNNLKEKIKDIIYPILGFDKNKSFWDNLIDAFKKGLKFIWETEIPNTSNTVISSITSFINQTAATIARLSGFDNFASLLDTVVRSGQNMTIGSTITALAGITAVSFAADHPILTILTAMMSILHSLSSKNQEAIQASNDIFNNERNSFIKSLSKMLNDNDEHRSVSYQTTLMTNMLADFMKDQTITKGRQDLVVAISRKKQGQRLASLPDDVVIAMQQFIGNPKNFITDTGQAIKTQDVLNKLVEHIKLFAHGEDLFASHFWSTVSDTFTTGPDTGDVMLNFADQLTDQTKRYHEDIFKQFDQYLKTHNLTWNYLGMTVNEDQLKQFIIDPTAAFKQYNKYTVDVTDLNGNIQQVNYLDILKYSLQGQVGDINERQRADEFYALKQQLEQLRQQILSTLSDDDWSDAAIKLRVQLDAAAAFEERFNKLKIDPKTDSEHDIGRKLDEMTATIKVLGESLSELRQTQQIFISTNGTSTSTKALDERSQTL